MDSAAITSCLLRALWSIKQMWDVEEQKGKKSPAELARVAGYRFEQVLAERREGNVMLGKGFVFWLKRFAAEVRMRPLISLFDFPSSGLGVGF